MTIRDYIQKELMDLEQGTPILLTTQAGEIETFKSDDPKCQEVRNYLLKWGGMQEGGFDGFSREGNCAYPYALGEIFRLDHLAEVWDSRAALVPVRVVDDKGLLCMTLEREPEEILKGKEAILLGVQESNLAEYKPLLEELL